MKICLTIISTFTLQLNLYAQIKIGYSFGVFGGDFKTSTYTNPLSISNKNCIMVSNGLSKFIVSDYGIFLNQCAVTEDYIKQSIQVAPNPVVNYTIIKFKNKLQVDEKFNITLFNSNGQQLNKYTTSQMQLLQGYNLSTADITEGVFFIQIQSSIINYFFRIIKL